MQNARWLLVSVGIVHLHDPVIMSMQHSHTFSTIDVPYSVEHTKQCKTCKHGHDTLRLAQTVRNAKDDHTSRLYFPECITQHLYHCVRALESEAKEGLAGGVLKD